MFLLEFTGPGTRTARFVTPDQDITLEFHCHVETHEKMGMHGRLVVGEGSAPAAHANAPPAEQARELHEGIGVVVSVELRESRVVLDHEAIPGFMAPMVMSYIVTPVEILHGLEAGQKVALHDRRQNPQGRRRRADRGVAPLMRIHNLTTGELLKSVGGRHRDGVVTLTTV